jgi:hypothetical protein
VKAEDLRYYRVYRHIRVSDDSSTCLEAIEFHETRAYQINKNELRCTRYEFNLPQHEISCQAMVAWTLTASGFEIAFSCSLTSSPQEVYFALFDWL